MSIEWEIVNRKYKLAKCFSEGMTFHEAVARFNSNISYSGLLHAVTQDVSTVEYSRLSLSPSRGDPLKHFEISVLRHIRCAELRKKTIEQPNFTNEHVI